jgi:uncharacterized membrane protein YadS
VRFSFSTAADLYKRSSSPFDIFAGSFEDELMAVVCAGDMVGEENVR